MTPNKPQVNVVYKPVARTQGASAETANTSNLGSAKPADPFRRAANEDDDGYDPYSDRPAEPAPLFERDPWS